jgi:hypothetical protein
MVKIIYFVTPSGLTKLGTKDAEFIPILGPSLEFTKKTQKLINLSNPVAASSRGVGLLFNYCFGKVDAITAECILWFRFSIAADTTANPTLIAVGA